MAPLMCRIIHGRHLPKLIGTYGRYYAIVLIFLIDFLSLWSECTSE